jgi:hypothetical protein
VQVAAAVEVMVAPAAVAAVDNAFTRQSDPCSVCAALRPEITLPGGSAGDSPPWATVALVSDLTILRGC